MRLYLHKKIAFIWRGWVESDHLSKLCFFYFFGGEEPLPARVAIATSQRLFDQNLHSVDAAVIVTANPACVLTG